MIGIVIFILAIIAFVWILWNIDGIMNILDLGLEAATTKLEQTIGEETQ